MKPFSLTVRTSFVLSIFVFALFFTYAITFPEKGEASPNTIFSNTSPITINTVPSPTPTIIPAATYPSTINVSGLTGTTTKVTVSLRGFTHRNTQNLDFLLVSPTGEKFIFLSDAGSFLNDVDVTFDDDAAILFPTGATVSTGSYKPRNIGSNDTFPAPAPSPPYNSSLNSTLNATFGGADPNGAWSLYIANSTNFSDEGSLNLGWSLDITTTNNSATTFANSNYLEIPWLKAKASPYGSTINVSGVSGVISDLKVSLNGITHGRTSDIDVLLVSPNGTGLIIMGDITGGSATNVDLIIDDKAPQSLPTSGQLMSGTYRPNNTSNSSGVLDSDTFLASAPLDPYFISNSPFAKLAQFNNISPNGDWTLYVMDDQPGESGEIAGGWSLDITTQIFIPASGGCLLPTLSFYNNFAVGTGPTDIEVGNFDGNQAPDLVVTNQISNNVSVLLNDGAGNFTNQPLLTAASGPYAVAVGRFNSDADDDIAVVNSASNNVSIFLGNGDGTFSSATNFTAGANPVSIAVADFDNDSDQDLVIANFGGFFSGTISVLLGDGNGGFGTPRTLRTRTQPSYVAVGDFNGDSKPDISVASFGSDSVAIFLNNNNGNFFLQSNVSVGAGPVYIDVVDFDNDNDLDIVVANYNTDNISFRTNDGNGNFSGGGNNTSIGLNPTAVISGDFTGNNANEFVASLSGLNKVKFTQGSEISVGSFPYSLVKGDFDGDGQLDIVTVNADSNDISVLLNSCATAIGNIFDFNGDKRTDYAVFRPEQAAWFSAAFGAAAPKTFGKPTDTLVPADYNGDGRTDYAFYRPESRLWRIVDRENFPIYYLKFGLPTDIPVPADYDGDTKADIAVWRPNDGTWYVRRSSDNALQIYQFGMDGDKPVPADYDGDGLTDFAIFRPSNGVWYIQKSSDSSFQIVQFGVGTDKLLPNDYDGDQKADIAVWRPSTGVWYVLRSTDGGFTIMQYGMEGDIPVPGDYEGDGKFDFAVFRPSERTWYVFRSSDSSSQGIAYGISTDIPIPNVFVR